MLSTRTVSRSTGRNGDTHLDALNRRPRFVGDGEQTSKHGFTRISAPTQPTTEICANNTSISARGQGSCRNTSVRRDFDAVSASSPASGSSGVLAGSWRWPPSVCRTRAARRRPAPGNEVRAGRRRRLRLRSVGWGGRTPVAGRDRPWRSNDGRAHCHRRSARRMVGLERAARRPDVVDGQGDR